jgi:hypothetical protein
METLMRREPTGCPSRSTTGSHALGLASVYFVEMMIRRKAGSRSRPRPHEPGAGDVSCLGVRRTEIAMNLSICCSRSGVRQRGIVRGKLLCSTRLIGWCCAVSDNERYRARELRYAPALGTRAGLCLRMTAYSPPLATVRGTFTLRGVARDREQAQNRPFFGPGEGLGALLGIYLMGGPRPRSLA